MSFRIETGQIYNSIYILTRYPFSANTLVIISGLQLFITSRNAWQSPAACSPPSLAVSPLANNLRICWTKILRIGRSIWKRFIKHSYIFRSLRGRRHGNQFCDQICESGRPHLHSARWRFETDCRITISISED